MKKQKCINCGAMRLFGGKVEGINITVCCEACCQKYQVSFHKLYAGNHRIPEKLAKRFYGCCRDDLEDLDFCLVYYPKQGRSVKLYLGAEVECLGRKRYKGSASFKEKKIHLEKALGTKLKKLDPVLCHFMIRDYLGYPKRPTVSLEDIRSRFNVLKIVRRIRKKYPKVHPMEAFDFCISNPHASAKDFGERKEKLFKVFRLEGDRIISTLNKADRDALMDTPLGSSVEEFRSHRLTNIRSILLNRVTSDVASEIMKSKACQLRIKREDDVFETAAKLLKFWKEKDDKELRRLDIMREFEVRGVSVNPSSARKEYIGGFVDYDAAEIVGVDSIAKAGPFCLTSSDRAVRVAIAVTKFERCFCERKMGYEESIKEALYLAQHVPLPDSEVESSWDYRQLAGGYWSDRWYLL